MRPPIQNWRKILRGGVLGAVVAALALCLAPLGARAAGGGEPHPTPRRIRRSSSHYRTVAYRAERSHRHKKSARARRRHHYRRRRYYYRRHRVRLPRVPSRERTEQIQEALARGGYYTRDPNGRWDRSTKVALRRFQEANGLAPTGKLDAPSLQKLGLGSDVAGVAAPKPIISANQTTDTFLQKSTGPGR